jgi:hypothetical protein
MASAGAIFKEIVDSARKHCYSTVAGAPTAVRRLGQFLKGHVGKPHRHSDLAAQPEIG